MQLQQKFASNIAVESEFFVHFFIRREMCNSPFSFIIFLPLLPEEA